MIAARYYEVPYESGYASYARPCLFTLCHYAEERDVAKAARCLWRACCQLSVIIMRDIA